MIRKNTWLNDSRFFFSYYLEDMQMFGKRFFAIFIFFISANLLFSQTRKGGEDEGSGKLSSYMLNIRYNVNVFHKYIFTEESKIIRTFSDDTQIEYKRNAVYYLTLLQNSLPQDGFTRLKVSIDSLEYQFFENGNKKYVYYSQDDNSVPPIKSNDFLNYIIPLGREYEMVYSSYREVANVEGEMLQEALGHLNHNERGIQDPSQKYIWNRFFGKEYLTFIGDVQKNLIPPERVFLDSAWLRPVNIFVNGVRFVDTAFIVLNDFSPREYIVEALLDSLTATDDLVSMYGLDDLIAPTEAKGSGKIIMNVSSSGQVQSSQLDVVTEVKAIIRKKHFTQKTESVFRWELDSMFR